MYRLFLRLVKVYMDLRQQLFLHVFHTQCVRSAKISSLQTAQARGAVANHHASIRLDRFDGKWLGCQPNRVIRGNREHHVHG